MHYHYGICPHCQGTTFRWPTEKFYRHHDDGTPTREGKCIVTDLMHKTLVLEIQEELHSANIQRTDTEVDNAIQGVLEDWFETDGFRTTSEQLRDRPDRLWQLKHEKLGVFDRLEIDSEDALHDRLA